MSYELVVAIENGDAIKLKEVFQSVINNKVSQYLSELKQDIAFDMFDEEYEEDEDGEVDEARIKRVNRIRGGVVQRRKIVATDKHYRTKTTGQKTSLVRMSASERRNRSLAQKKAARKRKASMSRSMVKRRLTNRKRETRGFNR